VEEREVSPERRKEILMRNMLLGGGREPEVGSK